MASVSPSSAADPSGEPIPTSAVLMAASRHIGLRCEAENLEFLRCKKKDPNPEKCLDKGQQVTRCVLGLYVSLSLISFYSSYVISICAIFLLCLGAETERNVEEDEEINMSNWLSDGFFFFFNFGFFELDCTWRITMWVKLTWFWSTVCFGNNIF